jgi:hypothetical protein
VINEDVPDPYQCPGQISSYFATFFIDILHLCRIDLLMFPHLSRFLTCHNDIINAGQNNCLFALGTDMDRGRLRLSHMQKGTYYAQICDKESLLTASRMLFHQIDTAEMKNVNKKRKTESDIRIFKDCDSTVGELCNPEDIGVEEMNMQLARFFLFQRARNPRKFTNLIH